MDPTLASYLHRPLPPVPCTPSATDSIYCDRPTSMAFSDYDFAEVPSPIALASLPMPPSPRRMSTMTPFSTPAAATSARKRSYSDPTGLARRQRLPVRQATRRAGGSAVPQPPKYLDLYNFLQEQDDELAAGDHVSDTPSRGHSFRHSLESAADVRLAYLEDEDEELPESPTPTLSRPGSRTRPGSSTTSRRTGSRMPTAPPTATPAATPLVAAAGPPPAHDPTASVPQINLPDGGLDNSLLTPDEVELAAGCYLRDESGAAVLLDDLMPQWDPATPPEQRDFARRPRLAVLFIGHWWCGLCQDYTNVSVSQLAPQALADANVNVILVSTGGWKAIKRYRELFRCPFPVYVTARGGPGRLADLLRLGKSVPNPIAEMRIRNRPDYHRRPFYQQMLSGFRNGIFRLPLTNPGNFMQLGGEFVFGPGYACEFAHRMSGRGDHCEAYDVVRAVGVARPTHRAVRQAAMDLESAMEVFMAEQAWLERRRLKMEAQAQRGESTQSLPCPPQTRTSGGPGSETDSTRSPQSEVLAMPSPSIPSLAPTLTRNESRVGSCPASPVSGVHTPPLAAGRLVHAAHKHQAVHVRWKQSIDSMRPATVCSLEPEDEDELLALRHEFKQAMALDPTGGRQALAMLVDREQARFVGRLRL